jgi:hypothetical protein
MRAQFRRDAAEISVRGAVTFTVTAPRRAARSGVVPPQKTLRVDASGPVLLLGPRRFAQPARFWRVPAGGTPSDPLPRVAPAGRSQRSAGVGRATMRFHWMSFRCRSLLDGPGTPLAPRARKRASADIRTRERDSNPVRGGHRLEQSRIVRPLALPGTRRPAVVCLNWIQIQFNTDGDGVPIVVLGFSSSQHGCAFRR